MVGNRSLEDSGGIDKGPSFYSNNILIGEGAEAYHKYRVQNISDDHKERRAEFCEYLLGSYGVNPPAETRWYRLINTEFSAKFICY